VSARKTSGAASRESSSRSRRPRGSRRCRARSCRGIGGLAEAKVEIQTYASAATDPDVYARWGTHPPSGVLLFGQRGVGKELLARSLAALTQTSFLSLAIPKLGARGDPPQRKVGELVAGWSTALAEMPPLTVLFNELEFLQAEEIGTRRLDLPVGPVMDFLLDLVDRAIAIEQVLVVGSTSHPDTLRRAFTQPGRPRARGRGEPELSRRHHRSAADPRPPMRRSSPGRALFQQIDWQQVVASVTIHPMPATGLHILHSVLRRKARCEAAGGSRHTGHERRLPGGSRAVPEGEQPARDADRDLRLGTRMDTWLVTGGAGFIGCNFVRMALAKTGAHVVVLDKLTYAGNLANLADVGTDPRFAFVRADIADREARGDRVREHRPTAVVNFAAESHVDRSIDDPADFVRTNVGRRIRAASRPPAASSRPIPNARARFRFLHVSTDEVYGSLGETGAFCETTPYEPNSPYSASKAGADHLVRAYHATYGVPALITNCSNNYGPYQFPEKLIR
jgi:NAD(P)-dependent dehydrogenase (short-subunit alcohol dehydrogenase family)